MPKIRSIITGPWNERVPITSAEDSITSALCLDHCCDTNYCDIRAAMQRGYPLAAAHLLIGAMETPALVLVLAALRFNGTHLPNFYNEFDEWCASTASEADAQCPECGARLYDVDPYNFVCGNCAHHFNLTASE